MSQINVNIPEDIEMRPHESKGFIPDENQSSPLPKDGVVDPDGTSIHLTAQNYSPTTTLNRDPRHKVWQLITFLRRVFIYFVVVILADNNRLFLPLWGRLIFKCLPIFTLSVFIYKQYNSLGLLWNNRYALFIFVGMTLSYIADGLLVYQNLHTGYFLSGLILFAIAHLFYTFAFGWLPLQSRMLIRSLIATALVYYYLYSANLQTSGMGLIIGVAFYILIIFAMQWRAWARISYRDVTEGRYYEILGALGASFFALSDAILGVNKFSFPVPGADYSIIAFYYLGQMLIALSVIDGPNIEWSQEHQDQTDGINKETSKPIRWITLGFHWLIS